MKQIFLFGILLAFTCQIKGLAQENIDQLKTVEKLKVSGKILIEIRLKDEYSLDIKSPELQADCFEHGIENGVLTLKIKTSFDCDGEVKAVLTLPHLKEIELSGKAELSTFNLLKGDSLVIVQQMGSKAYMDVDVKYLQVKLMEGSTLDMEGYALNQKISVTSKALFSGLDLEGEKADITASFLSTAKVCVTEELKATASSNAYIVYQCEPKHTELKNTLGGKIEKSLEP